VARHIPLRTRDTRSPGSDVVLGTFTAATTPTDAQAQQAIDDTVAALVADVGPLPAGAALSADIAVAARVAAEWRCAADIEIAWPNRDADLRLYDQLNARAADALVTLRRVMVEAGAGLVEAYPEWALPAAPAWGDTSPGSGADYAMGPAAGPPQQGGPVYG